ncbi:MAG TPA: polyamine ABC transporter substrate-binding protein [Steroidobacteraceae bacterium]|nr:polyamine ABC transporter substrate-binding protein [Steroidobacteraceae bacterium]
MNSAFRSLGLGACLALAIVGCSGAPDAGPAARAASGTPISSEKVLNVYNWSDYIEPSVVAAFEQEYGIKVNYDVYDSNEQLETKLLVGHSSYDVVVPSGAFFERQIKAGLYQKLDQAQLPNLKNLDPEAMRGLAMYDPGNQYGVVYTWLSTTGIGYDVVKVKARLQDAPVDSWRMLYDPAVIAKFQDCGVSVLDAPVDVLGSVLFFLGKDPNSESPQDLKAVEQVLLSIRPYVRLVDSTRYYYALANGEVCLVLGWAGDVTLARTRAKQAGNGVQIAYSIPKEGTNTFFDVVAIPVDAPHPGNAHLFINYLLRPDVAAMNSNKSKYANPVPASMALLEPGLADDPGVYPPPEARARFVPVRAKSEAFTRLLNRTWTRFKTGR